MIWRLISNAKESPQRASSLLEHPLQRGLAIQRLQQPRQLSHKLTLSPIQPSIRPTAPFCPCPAVPAAHGSHPADWGFLCDASICLSLYFLLAADNIPTFTLFILSTSPEPPTCEGWLRSPEAPDVTLLSNKKQTN